MRAGSDVDGRFLSLGRKFTYLKNAPALASLWLVGQLVRVGRYKYRSYTIGRAMDGRAVDWGTSSNDIL